jgi:membrane protein involved in colicin uptake
MPDETTEVQPESQSELEALSTEETEPTTETETPEVKVFDEDYVKELRAESAKYRKRAQEAEAKVSEFDKAQMSEIEKAQAETAEAKADAEKTANLLSAERLRNAVTLEATRMNFRDPGDALAMLNVDDLNYDEETGKPSTKSVQGALQRLVKDKPYLIESATPTPGTADGGARGGTGELTQEQKIAQYEKELQEKYGTVPTPAL